MKYTQIALVSLSKSTDETKSTDEKEKGKKKRKAIAKRLALHANAKNPGERLQQNQIVLILLQYCSN